MVKPVPASRPRVPRFGKPYFLKTYKKWRDDAGNDLPHYNGKPIDEPVYLNVLFAIPRAKSSKLIVPAGDIDNFEKGLYDLLVRKEYLSDDKWITTHTVRKRFLPCGSQGYAEVTIMKEKDSVDIRN
jgi:Holliday junction resolvase RusA-like endonuclease